MIRRLTVVAAALAASCVLAEPTTTPSTKPTLSLAEAKQLSASAQAYAAQHGWPCSIAIVDDGGWPILTARMDGAPVVAGIELAQGKAKTAAIFKRSSGDLETSVNSGRAAAITSGFVMMKGGLPVKSKGVVVGAIGVSGDTPDHDIRIAMAALEQ